MARRLDRRSVARRDEDARAFRHQRLGTRAPEPLARSGYKGTPVLQTEVHGTIVGDRQVPSLSPPARSVAGTQSVKGGLPLPQTAGPGPTSPGDCGTALDAALGRAPS